MSGIYIHIPFCKQACHYCNFHFSTSMKYKSDLMEAMHTELDLQKEYLKGNEIDTIYLGGGTPSLLSAEELNALFEKIFNLHQVKADAEITLETNPDDLTEEKITALKNSPVNRLSIGIQSFSEEDLRFMNRAHSATEAVKCLKLAQAAGFDNITVDLIYGSPTTSDEQWEENIHKVLSFEIPHLSCYCLTVEPKTALHHFVKTGKCPPVDEEKAARHFEILMDILEANGYEHYEISNFSKPGYFSRHNSSYWLGKSYLGIGPSAHSFDGSSRQWNVAHNIKYLKSIQNGVLPFEVEQLSPAERYNEYVMTRLRTVWGCVFEEIEEDFRTHFLTQVEPFLKSGHVLKKAGIYSLSRSGKLMADKISMEIFG